ncbi:P-loop NTPase fold protein [Streptomyces sp. SL13]|uniref:P-loop NTPase fold protein n=1 Tax=Streptantibioticus silvisoli TaxID=2705255 RepID=A0AA90GWI8_9ACTN|nr:P-loop NTPase fold protein [Streptantibioticus silvisoli]MDI5969408.1 P-loop NTPase fold protein [Streptantibioticus silvisoli]
MLLRLFAPALVWLVVAAVAIVAVYFTLHLVAPHARHWLLTAPLLAGVPAVVGSMRPFLKKWKAWKTALPATRAVTEEVRARAQSDLGVAEAEVTALEREMQNLTAAGQLAGLVGERAAAGDYRSQLGVMTQIREDFERMASILANDTREHRASTEQAEPVKDSANDALPKIDRIVVYIDDLDRCPPARVMEMLEAVHLLLAVELFVVVMAIDPRWLLSAVAAHYRDVLHVPGNLLSGDDDTRASTPAQYLEKIFQVMLTLPPVDRDGHTHLIDSLIDVQAPTTGADESRTEVSTIGTPTPTPPAQQPTGQPADLSTNTDGPWDEEMYGPSVDGLPVVELPDPLTFTEDEARLLRLVGPPNLPLTPRSIKRLVNSYGLRTALRQPHHQRDLEKVPATTAPDGTPMAAYHPYRAGLVLLAALVAYPSIGQHLCRHMHHQADDTTWETFLNQLKSLVAVVGGIGVGDEKSADPNRIDPRQMTALHAALKGITAEAADQGLPLPDRLAAWKPWIVPTARLSFPAGQIVKTLTAQPTPSPRQDGR